MVAPLTRSTSLTAATMIPATLVANLDHHDATCTGVLGRRQAETAAQVDHRDDLAAQVDDAFDERGRPRHPGDRLQADDLVDAGDVDAVQLGADLEQDELLLVATDRWFHRPIHASCGLHRSS